MALRRAVLIESPILRPVNPIHRRIGIPFLLSIRNRNPNPHQNQNQNHSLLLHHHWSQNQNNNRARDSVRSRSLNLLLSAAMSDEAWPSSAAKTVRVVIKGRVQGVFYRNWTIENAKVLGLRGWVRNRRDGSVEALFSGKSDSVAEMERRCRRGPPAAVVTGVEVFPSSDDPSSGFDRKPTV